MLGLSGIIVFIYSFLLFRLTSKIAKTRKLHKILLMLFCGINSIGFCFYIIEAVDITVGHYYLTISVFLIEALILYKAKFVGIATMVLGTMLHLFVLRSVVVSAFSLVNGLEPVLFLYDHTMLWFTTVLAIGLNICTLILFMTFISKKHMQIISENWEFISFIFVITLTLTLFMGANSYFFYNYLKSIVSLQQIMLAVTLLSIFYLTLLLMIRIIILHNFKLKTKELEDKITKDRVFKYALFHLADIVCEINCSKDKPLRLLFNGKEIEVDKTIPFTEQLDVIKSKYVHPDDFVEIEKIYPKRVVQDHEKGHNDFSFEFRSLRMKHDRDSETEVKKNDEHLWYRLKATSDPDNMTGDLKLVITIDEIQGEKEKELSLRRKAETDSITGALNKFGAQTRIDSHLSLNGIGSFFMFDLDNFKMINDTFGHSYGDFVLSDVSKMIVQLFRPYDVVARIGGDEFIVFMIGTIDRKVIEKKAGAICDILSKSYVGEGGKSVEISGSVGVSVSPQDGTDYIELFNAADKAMYHAKNSGKNQYKIYYKNMVVPPTENKR